MKKLTALWLSLLLAFSTLTGCAGQISIIGGEDGPTAIITSDSASAVSVTEDGQYDSKDEVAAYLTEYGHLPSNYITKKQAQALGWQGGSLEPYAPGCSIGGDRFGNYEGTLRTAAITSATSTPAEPTSAARNGWSTRTTAESTTPPTITRVLRKSQNSFYNNSISGEMRMKELLLDAETLYTREQLHDVLTKVCGFPADYGRNLDALYDLLTAYPAARLTLRHRRCWSRISAITANWCSACWRTRPPKIRRLR